MFTESWKWLLVKRESSLSGVGRGHRTGSTVGSSASFFFDNHSGQVDDRHDLVLARAFEEALLTSGSEPEKVTTEQTLVAWSRYPERTTEKILDAVFADWQGEEEGGEQYRLSSRN